METDEQIATNHDKNSNFIPTRIAQLVIERPAITDAEIANEVGLSRQTVNRHRNSDAVRGLLVTYLTISEKRLRRLMSKSLDRLEAALDDSDPKIRMAAATRLIKYGSEQLPSITATSDPFGDPFRPRLETMLDDIS